MLLLVTVVDPIMDL